MRHRPGGVGLGSELSDITGPWGRRYRGTRGPARSRGRPWGRRSVHRSTKMASRHHFGAFVYTVAARVASDSASGAAARLASSQGINPHKPSRSPSSCPGGLTSCMRYALADLTAATAAAILCGSLTRFVSRAVFMSIPQGLRRSIASGMVWTERPPARM